MTGIPSIESHVILSQVIYHGLKILLKQLLSRLCSNKHSRLNSSHPILENTARQLVTLAPQHAVETLIETPELAVILRQYSFLGVEGSTHFKVEFDLQQAYTRSGLNG